MTLPYSNNDGGPHITPAVAQSILPHPRWTRYHSGSACSAGQYRSGLVCNFFCRSA
ncbi:hypothetical protein ACFXHA_06820 [Nocardia sp. NPDC059240]|uniref:hypothetical protein n=1 Tax=Nocardia sp. NPDC059240 TaxID=3346786 RepID=UPI0036AEDB68